MLGRGEWAGTVNSGEGKRQLTPQVVEGSSSWPSPAGSGRTYLWPAPSLPPVPAALWMQTKRRNKRREKNTSHVLYNELSNSQGNESQLISEVIKVKDDSQDSF